LIVNTVLSPTYSVVTIGMLLSFGKVFCGQLKLQKWDLDGNLGMGEELGSAKTCGLDHVV
jgi:hypothetical protein